MEQLTMIFNVRSSLLKNVSTSAFSCAVIIAATSYALNSQALAVVEEPVLVSAPVQKVFVPLGFDNNDNVEVVVHGHFSNSCYKVGPSNATVDTDAKTVTIQAQAFEYPQAICAQMQVPFTVEVKIGLLKEGEYRVLVAGSPDLVTDPLIVGAATTSNPDDYIYAPVHQASIVKDAQGVDHLQIEGVYPYMFIGCMKISEVRVSQAPGQVIVVQPIAEILEDRLCSPLDSKNFTILKAIEFPLTFTEYLIHVRTLSGTSVNRFIELGN